jgi:hypothetical protein
MKVFSYIFYLFVNKAKIVPFIIYTLMIKCYNIKKIINGVKKLNREIGVNSYTVPATVMWMKFKDVIALNV